MAIRKLRPITNGTRHAVVVENKHLDKVRPLKSLTLPLKSSYGRDNYGHRTAVNRRKGHKRLYRVINFKRNKKDVPGKVATIEYDPNRSCHIALIHYLDGAKEYIIATKDMKKGDMIISSDESVEIKSGNATKLKNIPDGILIHAIELRAKQGAKLVRSAGAYARLKSKDGDYCFVEFPSKELRKIHKECMATIGIVSNHEHQHMVLGKAGKSYHRGRRPHVRGSAMNPVDHPHGGGNGKTGIGRPTPMTPYGKKGNGVKTRDKKKHSSKYIVRRRK